MVVFVKYAMDDDGRRGKRVGKGGIWRRVFGGSGWSPSASVGAHRQSNLSLAPTSPPHERRPLRSVPTVGSQFKVDPEVLAKDYVEKETKYIGTISDVPHNFDAGNRVMVLSLLDEKKKLGFFPYRLNWRHDVVISFCVYNVKISRRDGEELIHRIPTHQIAATGYVQDDSQTYLFFKFASEVNDEMCNLAFFSCESQVAAQEICRLTQQLFQLAYTNSTMEFFDKSIRDGALTPKHHSLSTDDSAEKKDTVKLQPYQASSPSDSVEIKAVVNGHPELPSPPQYKASTLPFTSNSQHHHSHNTTPPATSSTPSSPSTLRSSLRSESHNSSMATPSNSNHQQLQLHEYIEVLRERLTQEELRKFAEHLHHFRKGTLPIKIFCERLLAIYTEQRKSLLLGMRHFIPERKDHSYFENFLKRHDVETGSDDVRWWDQPPTSRTLSETDGSYASTTINVNELSSNSDHVSPSHTSNEDSGEWKLVVEKMRSLKCDDDLSSTTLKRSSVEVPQVESPTQTGADDGTKPAVETSTNIPNLVLNLSEWDSPVLRSGQNKEEGDQEPVLPHRRGDKQIKKKKVTRGKSPSAAEMGAPFPSLLTGGTDDDLDPNIDKKTKKALKYKRKEKTRNSDTELQTPDASKDVVDESRKSTDDLTRSLPSSDTDRGSNTKKKFFKTKAAKTKDKKETSGSSINLTASPDQSNPPDAPVVTSKPPRKEHRKKRKHKGSDEPPEPSSTAF